MQPIKNLERPSEVVVQAVPHWPGSECGEGLSNVLVLSQFQRRVQNKVVINHRLINLVMLRHVRQGSQPG